MYLDFHITYRIIPQIDKCDFSIISSNSSIITSGSFYYDRDIQEQLDMIHKQVSGHIQAILTSDADFQQYFKTYKFNKNIGAV